MQKEKIKKLKEMQRNIEGVFDESIKNIIKTVYDEGYKDGVESCKKKK